MKSPFSKIHTVRLFFAPEDMRSLTLYCLYLLTWASSRQRVFLFHYSWIIDYSNFTGLSRTHASRKKIRFFRRWVDGIKGINNIKTVREMGLCRSTQYSIFLFLFDRQPYLADKSVSVDSYIIVPGFFSGHEFQGNRFSSRSREIYIFCARLVKANFLWMGEEILGASAPIFSPHIM